MATVIRDQRFAKGECPVPLIYSRLSAHAKLVWTVLDSYGDTPFARISLGPRKLKAQRARRSKDHPKRGPRPDDEKSDFEQRCSLSADTITAALKELVHAGCLKIITKPGKPSKYYLTMPDEEAWAKSIYSRKLSPDPALADLSPKTVGPQRIKGVVPKASVPGGGTGKAGTRYRDPRHLVPTPKAPLIKGLSISLKERLEGTGFQPRMADQAPPVEPGESPIHAVLRQFQNEFPGQEVPPQILAAIRAEERNTAFMHKLAEKLPAAPKAAKAKPNPNQLGLL